MSSKKSKLDLLVRVRYSNPLPAPPCPPKLLDIPTDPLRYAQPEFLSGIAGSTPLPIIVDADLGMPLDLSQWESLWGENGNDLELNPDPNSLPELDPKDQFLIGDTSGALFGNSYGGPTSGSQISVQPVPHVTWLRKTEYLSRDITTRGGSGSQDALMKVVRPPDIDVSRAAQIRDIEASFAATENFDLNTLKHPNKPDVVAVDSYEIFPDADIWANAYDLFRFSERPGERLPDVEDPRLDCAILRPMESDGDHFLAFYLTKDDETALEFKQTRLAGASAEEPTPFHFVRDYETVKVEQEVPNEFLLVLGDGDDVTKSEDEDDDDRRFTRRRAKGAYYKNIERKMLLKKKRANSYEAEHEKWDIVKVTHVPMSKEEEEEREEALAEVLDPMYLLSRGEADAEGDVDESMGGVADTGAIHDSGGVAQSTLEADTMDVFGEV